jgi:hypothetical protein
MLDNASMHCTRHQAVPNGRAWAVVKVYAVLVTLATTNGMAKSSASSTWNW